MRIRVAEWTDGWADGRMDARAGGQTDGQKDGGRSIGTGLTVGMAALADWIWVRGQDRVDDHSIRLMEGRGGDLSDPCVCPAAQRAPTNNGNISSPIRERFCGGS